eukprot:235894-Chlamydomonas_euryale.AAC.2
MSVGAGGGEHVLVARPHTACPHNPLHARWLLINGWKGASRSWTGYLWQKLSEAGCKSHTYVLGPSEPWLSYLLTNARLPACLRTHMNMHACADLPMHRCILLTKCTHARSLACMHA